MFREAVCGVMLSLLLIGIFFLAVNIKPVKSEWTGGTIYIRADGSIDPPDAPVITYDNITYTLTGNITSTDRGIVVERDNIIIDGAGYTLVGPWYTSGIVLYGRKNVTIKNMQIKNFGYGIHMLYSSNNIISGNTFTDIDLYSIVIGFCYSNSICRNTMERVWHGFALGYSYDNIISGNTVKSYNEIVYIVDSSNNWFYRNNFISGYVYI